MQGTGLGGWRGGKGKQAWSVQIVFSGIEACLGRTDKVKSGSDGQQGQSSALTGHVRRWKKCSFPTCVVTENSRNYMYVLSFGQLKGYDKSFPRAPNPPRLTCEDRSSLSLRRD